MKTLLSGKPYTASHETNLWKVFKKEKKRLREEEEKKRAELERISRNVHQFGRKA